MKYTVVGVHPDELDHCGADDASYVEWVEAESADAAVEAVKRAVPDGSRDGTLVVAVFEGHVIDALFTVFGSTRDGEPEPRPGRVDKGTLGRLE